MNSLIEAIRATPDGEEIDLSVIRDDNGFAQSVSIKPKRAIAKLDPSSSIVSASGPQTIGVLLTPNFVKSQMLKSNNPMEAARLAFQYTCTLTSETANGLLKALGQALFRNGGNSPTAAQISGPIGVIREGSNVVATKDIHTVLLFAAAISINLGVINAVPIPALDGGQLMFILAEAITRRKIDQRLQEGLNGVTILLILFVSFNAALGDIFNIIGR